MYVNLCVNVCESVCRCVSCVHVQMCVCEPACITEMSLFPALPGAGSGSGGVGLIEAEGTVTSEKKGDVDRWRLEFSCSFPASVGRAACLLTNHTSSHCAEARGKVQGPGAPTGSWEQLWSQCLKWP